MEDKEYRDLQTVYYYIKDLEQDIIQEKIDDFLEEINDTTIIEYPVANTKTNFYGVCRDMLGCAEYEGNVEIRTVLFAGDDFALLSTKGCKTAREMVQAAKKRRDEIQAHPICKHLKEIENRLSEEQTRRYQLLLDRECERLQPVLQRITYTEGTVADVIAFNNHMARLKTLTTTRGFNKKMIPVRISEGQAEQIDQHIYEHDNVMRSFIKKTILSANKHQMTNVFIIRNNQDNSRE